MYQNYRSVWTQSGGRNRKDPDGSIRTESRIGQGTRDREAKQRERGAVSHASRGRNVANTDIMEENPRVETLQVRGVGRVTEKTDVEIAEKEKWWLDGVEQVIKPIVNKGSPREVNIENTEPCALSFNNYAKSLDPTRGVGRKRHGIRRTGGADHREKPTAAAATPAI